MRPSRVFFCPFLPFFACFFHILARFYLIFVVFWQYYPLERRMMCGTPGGFFVIFCAIAHKLNRATRKRPKQHGLGGRA
jgi:hypothetical protein